MLKIILCLLVAVFSYSYALPATYAVDCRIDPVTKTPILNEPPNCTPKPTQAPAKTPNDQPATDTKPATQTPVEIAKEAQVQASQTYTQAETSYSQQLESVNALINEVRELNSHYNNTTTEPNIDDFSTTGVTEQERNKLLTELQNKQDALSAAKTDLESKKTLLDQAEQEKKDKSDAVTAAEREAAKERRYLSQRDFIKDMEAKRKRLVGETVNLRDMGITIGSEITTTDALFSNTIKFLARSIGTLAVLSLMLSGFFMMTSMGNEDQQTKAKDIFWASIWATVFVLSAYAIVTGLQQIIYSLGK